MRGEQLWLEGIAHEVRARARLGEHDLAMSPTIIKRVLGRGITIAPDLGDTACISFLEDPPRIYLRALGPDSNFDGAHELGHWAVRVIGRYTGPLEERYANYVAAAMLAPESVVRDVHRRHRGLRAVRPLSDLAVVSQTAANLRLAEVIGDERAVVTVTGNVIARGRRVRGLIEDGAPGLAKVRLRGGIDEGRVAFRVR